MSWRRSWTGIGVALLVAVGSSAMHGGSAAAAAKVTRISGADRYETSVAISKTTFGKTTDVVLARSDSFSDAASASYLSGAIDQTPHPILLTASDSLPDSVFNEIKRLGPSRVWLMGDRTAISKAVEDRIKSLGVSIVRVGGKDRYETARLLVTDARLPMGRTAFLVNGGSPADAISAASLSAAAELPLLYTEAATLHPQAKRAIEFGGFRRVVIVGGEQAVSAQVAAELAKVCPNGRCVTVERVAGADRTETAVAMAKWAIANINFSSSHINVVRGDRSTDAATAAAHAAVERAPLLITRGPNDIGIGIKTWLGELGSSVTSIDVIGDQGAVSDSVVQQIVALTG
jgi:stage II sporulation protein D